ncbi:hypothetical protein ABK040_001191 [Willaertia magna]
MVTKFPHSDCGEAFSVLRHLLVEWAKTKIKLKTYKFRKDIAIAKAIHKQFIHTTLLVDSKDFNIIKQDEKCKASIFYSYKEKRHGIRVQFIITRDMNLKENNWNRFYKEDNVEHNIKEINYEKGKKRNNIELQEFKKRKWEEEENEEREYKKEKLSVMDISKVKEIFELNTTDELFTEMLLKVMKAYTLVVTSSAGIMCYFCKNVHCIRVAVQNYATKRPNHY